jgi:hypothetical protein
MESFHGVAHVAEGAGEEEEEEGAAVAEGAVELMRRAHQVQQPELQARGVAARGVPEYSACRYARGQP